MIEIEALTKRYGRNTALSALSLRLPRGQITGIVGHNGAGKSTLINILAGEAQPDEGLLKFDGAPWQPALGARVGIVHQDPKLFGNMTAGENLLVGREGRALWRPRPGVAEQEVLERLELSNIIDERVGTLPLAVQQRIEIARALAWDSDIFLFDEPNSALTIAESEYLFARMRALAVAGKVVILVSHRLDEVAANCDAIALLRNGQLKGEVRGRMTAAALTEMMMEGTDAAAARSHAAIGGRGLSIQGWSADQFNINAMHFPSGEVSVLVGVEGSGARPLLSSFAGDTHAAGEVNLVGKKGSAALVNASAIYLAGDRRDTVFSHLSVADNLMMRRDLQSVPALGGMIDRGGLRRASEALKREHNIICRSVDDPASSLSGGNQQKMVIASALVAGPKVLAIEEPTRGVDVGNRVEIHAQLHKFAAAGHIVIAFCADETEAYELADVVHVVDRGTAIAELRPRSFSGAEPFAEAVGAAIAASRAVASLGVRP